MNASIFKRPGVTIVLTMILAISLVAVIAWTAIRPTKAPTGFNRYFNKSKLNFIKSFNIPSDVGDFVGKTEYNVFCKTITPTKVFKLNFLSGDTGYMQFKYPFEIRQRVRFNCIVDSPNVYFLFGNDKKILRFNGDRLSHIYQFPNSIFTRTVKLSENNFVLRSFEGLDQIFTKKNFETGTFHTESNISEKLGDAGISTDGILMYDTISHLVTYVFYDRNQFICIDSNLNLFRRVNTIDINSRSLSQNDMVQSNGIITTAAPKRGLNIWSEVNDGFLFINSNIKADNEPQKDFDRNSAIDIYRLIDGQFISSFYVPNYRYEKMRRFMIAKNRLFAQYKSYLLEYDLTNIKLTLNNKL